jgi:hypothetical protein
MLTRALAVLLPLLTISALLACGNNGGGLPATLSECPDDSTVNWDVAGPVFEAHCTSCHNSTKSGSERVGATEDVDYDTADLAYNSPETTASSTWSQIYGGAMPPGDATVPEADALIIHEWLSCGGPE